MGKAIIIVIATGLSIFCWFDIVGTPARRVPTVPKWVWMLAMLLPVVGPITWLVTTRRPSRPVPAPPKVRGPDDDPDFLRGLDRPDNQTLGRWEDELRRDDSDDDPHPHPHP